jgi:UDP-N-acetyl-D-mannosaminuronate dehydrogenase
MEFTFGQVTAMDLGHIRLPTAPVLARAGHAVHGVDVNVSVIEKTNAGEIHINEANIDWLVRDMVDLGRLRAPVDVAEADIYLIAVPTLLRGSREPGVSYLEAAMRAIAPTLRKKYCVLIESTSPVGTTERAGELLRRLRPDLAIRLADTEGDFDITLTYCLQRVLPRGIALKIAIMMAKKFRSRLHWVEPYVEILPDVLTRHVARLSTVEHALEKTGVVVILVDNEVFDAIPRELFDGKIILDSRAMLGTPE